MNLLSKYFLNGLLALLPLVLTVWIVYGLGSACEQLLGGLLLMLLPQGWYLPGMGLLFGVVFTTLIGLLLNAWIFRKLSAGIELLFNKIPLIKVVYSSIRDISRFASASENEEQLRSVVLVELTPGMQAIGFVTDKATPFSSAEALVAVYLPLSYQIGGFTLLLPESRLQRLDIPADQAMRYVVTAGMTQISR